MNTPRQLAILGSTGSIGVNTLDVVARHPDRFQVVALTAHRQIDLLFQQCVEFRPQYAVLDSPQAADDLRARLRAHGLATAVLHGERALEEVASLAEVDTVMAAIVGIAGLRASFAAAGGHPLHAAVAEQALIAGRVAVAHAPGNHVGDGLEAAVRVVGKAGDVVAGLVRAKGVEAVPLLISPLELRTMLPDCAVSVPAPPPVRCAVPICIALPLLRPTVPEVALSVTLPLVAESAPAAAPPVSVAAPVMSWPVPVMLRAEVSVMLPELGVKI